MPDLSAGTIIRGVDTPPNRRAQSNTLQSNISATNWTPGSPEVGVAFTAPTSDAVLVMIGGGLRAQTSGAYVQMTVEIFAGVDNTGVQVYAPDPTRGLRVPFQASDSDFVYLGRGEIFDGFTPGNDYYARLVHEVDTGATADINHRTINVMAAP